MSQLVVDNVVKRFRQGDRDVSALDGVSLDVAEGTFLAIMGASGSGKSTLLHLMAGLATPDSGRVVIRGENLAQMNDRELTLFRRRHIGLVFQAFNLIPTLTAEENIALPLLLDGKNAGEASPKIAELTETLGLASRRSHRPDAMSGGEQQRVAIGRALVTDPAVLLADEPTGNLDTRTSYEVLGLLQELNRKNRITIVLVTHEPDIAACASRVINMRDGRVRSDTYNEVPVDAHKALADLPPVEE